MRKKDPKIIRVGDFVRIINPQFFERCGYPLSFQDAVEQVGDKYKKQIIRFIIDIGLTSGFSDKSSIFNMELGISGIKLGTKTDIKENRTFHKIARALAWDYVRKKNFGGKERKIYTKYMPNYFNKIMKVTGINFNQTGIYFAPSGGYDPYHGDYDFEPGGLDRQRTHKILTVVKTYQSQDGKRHGELRFVGDVGDLKIEAVHVRKEKNEEDYFN